MSCYNIPAFYANVSIIIIIAHNYTSEIAYPDMLMLCPDIKMPFFIHNIIVVPCLEIAIYNTTCRVVSYPDILIPYPDNMMLDLNVVINYII